VTREGWAAAVDAGSVVVAHAIRGAIHALAPADRALFGAALVADDDAELGVQLGRQVQRLGVPPVASLAAVTGAVADALGGGGALGKDALHEELRARVAPELMPWCRGCGTHHVAPMLWRYATVRAGVRLDAERRYVRDGPQPDAPAAEAVRRFLHVYGPSTPAAFADWAGLAPPHGRRLWDAVAGELAEVRVAGRRAWLMGEDVAALEAPPAARGVRLLPPGDPFLQAPNRPLLTPDPELRRRVFRPAGSPGAVLAGGRLAGLWRVRAKGRRAELTVEPLGPLPREELEAEAQRLAVLKGAAAATVVVA